MRAVHLEASRVCGGERVVPVAVSAAASFVRSAAVSIGGVVWIAFAFVFAVAGCHTDAASDRSVETVMSAPVHHTINYIEIQVRDMAEAKAFYAAAFGWTFNEYGPEYAGIVEGDGEAGGLYQGPPVVPGGPLVILYSTELEATRDAVVAAGGVIVADIFDFPGGRRFEFTDPSGHRLGVWSDGGV